MLNELEDHERKYIKIESDAIRKLIVAEISMFKNVEYDIINIINVYINPKVANGKNAS